MARNLPKLGASRSSVGVRTFSARWVPGYRHRNAHDRLRSCPREPFSARDRVACQVLPAWRYRGRFRIPAEHLHAVIDGVEMDLVQCRYEDFEHLQQYCQRVASAVGLACIHIWGFHASGALEPARKCGVAMQLTNILRDLKADATLDRVYLPLADLRQCDYTVEELKAGLADERFDRLMNCEIARADRFYREGLNYSNGSPHGTPRVGHHDDYVPLTPDEDREGPAIGPPRPRSSRFGRETPDRSALDPFPPRQTALL